VAVRNDRQSARNEIAHLGSIQSGYDCFNATLFHSSISPQPTRAPLERQFHCEIHHHVTLVPIPEVDETTVKN
jgi:hypothetical protein